MATQITPKPRERHPPHQVGPTPPPSDQKNVRIIQRDQPDQNPFRPSVERAHTVARPATYPTSTFGR